MKIKTREIIIPLLMGIFVYLFHTINIPLVGNVILSLVLTLLIAVIYDQIIFIASKNKRDLKSLEVPFNIIVSKSEDGSKLVSYNLPFKFKKAFFELFGTNTVIKEEEFVNFILDNTTKEEGVTFFATIHKNDEQIFYKSSFPLTDNHLSAVQNYHISYYEKLNDGSYHLKIISEIDGIPITKDLKQSFTFFVTKEKKKGEKVLMEDFERWKEINLNKKGA